MKALSIQQPWAWLIIRPDLDREEWERQRIAGIVKDVENRDWSTNVRGPIFIHAGKKFDYDGYDAVRERIDGAFKMPRPSEYQTGGIVGAAKLVDCVTRWDSPLWFVGKFGFVLHDAIVTEFFPCRGQLGFFDVIEFRRAASGVGETKTVPFKRAAGSTET